MVLNVEYHIILMYITKSDAYGNTPGTKQCHETLALAPIIGTQTHIKFSTVAKRFFSHALL